MRLQIEAGPLVSRPPGGRFVQAFRPMPNPTYPSRIDAWLIVLTLAVVGVLVWRAIRAPADALASLGVIGLMLGIGLATSFPCTYTLTGTHLVIRSGLFRQRIAYRDITAVAMSRSVWAAPALSLDRVRIDYAGRFQLVSPRQREDFMAELRRRVDDARAV